MDPVEMESARVEVLLCTAPADAAPRIARALVEREVAACVNRIDAVTSVYRWEGDICEDAETLLVVKTSAACREACREAIVELHPYSVPEVIALPVAGGHAPYLDWVFQSTRGRDGES